MINSEITARANLNERIPVKNPGVHVVCTIGLTEAKMALNDEQLLRELVNRVGEEIKDELEHYLSLPETRDAINAIGS